MERTQNSSRRWPMLRFDRRLIHYFDWVMLLLLILVSGLIAGR